MPQAKLSKQFTYYKPGTKMVDYPKGYEGDMPQAHYDNAVQSGAVEGTKAAPEFDAATADAQALQDNLSKEQLQKRAKDAGLTEDGSKAELAERIVAARG
jgi:hypothetical protein